MIKISPLLFLFIIQGIVVLIGVTLYMLFKYRKMLSGDAVRLAEIEKLQASAESAVEENEELLKYKEMFNDLQVNFEHMKTFNAELQDTVEQLVPEAEQSEEYKKMLAQFEQYNAELDKCLGTLEKENRSLDVKIESYEQEVDGLQRKVDSMVTKDIYDSLEAEKARLENKLGKIQEKLDAKTEEYDKLDKNYMWLEKEYNALYESTEKDKNSS